VTGCVKNQFGCVPGALKGEFHVKLASAIDFARMLVDINAFLKPRLYVMDGIIAMEGNGPRGGKARPMKVLLFSADPVALDATVCRMIDINPEFVPTITLGMQAKTGTWKKDEIELVGDPFESFVDKEFDVKREPVQPYSRGKGGTLLRNAIVPKPYILAGKCTKCGTCVKACPVNPKAVDWHDGDKKVPPSYRYERCIRCYCCQELCPEGAVELRVPFIRKLLGKKRKQKASSTV
jgi:Pyruvate/2-oxoacid:ferredoxin oxidoreductase delta subunit